MIIKQISAKETYPLRIEILRKGIAINYTFLEDKLDSSIHLGAYINKQCIGIVTLIKKDLPNTTNKNSYQLRGMAIASSYQNKGIGEKIISESFRVVQNNSSNFIWCNARQSAIGFYSKVGFQIKGEAFSIENIGLHYIMYKEIISI